MMLFIVKGGSNFLSLWIESKSVTTQLKDIEQFFPVVLFFCAVQGGSSF